MSYSSQMLAMAGASHSELLQHLVHRLGWSYVALWALNPQTRHLSWKGGYWCHDDHDVFNEQFFNSTYQSCQFSPRFGSVGMAYSEGGNIWMNGLAILDNAGSKEQAEFLQHARIATAVFIPWSDGVLELGTRESEPENQKLMKMIRDYFMTKIVPTLGGQQQQQQPAGNNHHNSMVQSATTMQAGMQASPSFPQSSLTRSMLQQNRQQPASFSSTLSALQHLSDNLATHTFEPNPLNQQMLRRSASMSSLNPDMFLQQQQPEDATTTAGIIPGKEVVGNNVGVVDLDHTVDMLPVLPGDHARACWRLPTVTGGMELVTTQPAAAPMSNQLYSYPPVQRKTRGQYRSRSGTTSSSVSSLDETAAGKTTQLSVVDSPEHNLFFAGCSQRQTSHSNTSSSPRRGTSSRSPEMHQLEDTNVGKAGTRSTSLHENHHHHHVEDDIQLDVISLMLADGEPLDSHEQWRSISTSSLQEPAQQGNNNMNSQIGSHINLLQDSSTATNANNHNHNNGNNGNNGNNNLSPNLYTSEMSEVLRNEPQGPFKSWRHTRILAAPGGLQRNHNKDRQNQDLLRRCIGMMKQIPQLNSVRGMMQHGKAQAVMHNVAQHGPRVASSSSPETVADIGIVAPESFHQVPPRAQRRPRGGSRIDSMGPVHSGHDEAAMNHMMAERRRRVKQKENFAALRRLVPIISKADKASILGDAIVYLKDLQDQIEGLKASRADSERRYETLQKLYMELEHRNKELEQRNKALQLSTSARSTRLNSL